MNSLDINIFFKDKYERLCILASAGGILPKYLLDENGQDLSPEKILENNRLNNIIYEIPKNFITGRNPLLPSILKHQYPDIDIAEEFLDESDINEDFNFSTRYNIELSNFINENSFNNNESLEFSDYFFTFDDLASRGFFVYDKLNINHPEDDAFILVSYPIYDTSNPIHTRYYNQIKSSIGPILKLNTPIIDRYSNNLNKSSFRELNLIELINSV